MTLKQYTFWPPRPCNESWVGDSCYGNRGVRAPRVETNPHRNQFQAFPDSTATGVYKINARQKYKSNIFLLTPSPQSSMLIQNGKTALQNRAFILQSVALDICNSSTLTFGGKGVRYRSVCFWIGRLSCKHRCQCSRACAK